ncbi:MAG: nitrilase-related carbon-nitrogen hydrolase, partial [Terracoccus sp.]
RHNRVMTSESPRLRVAVWQCAPTPRDGAANLRRLAEVAQAAALDGAGLLVTPELTLTGYDVGDLAGLLRSDDVDGVAAIARDYRLALVVGLALRDDAITHNAAVTISASGELLATYRKAHLFGRLDHSRFDAGPAPFAIAELGGIRVATMVCYDVEFAEAVRAAALAGAHLVAVPTANMHPYDIVCEAVVPVRAWENQVYLAYANHCGFEGDTAYVGRSVIVAPDGSPAARAGAVDEQVIMADIDAEVVRAAQTANPYLTDRRRDLYEGLR